MSAITKKEQTPPAVVSDAVIEDYLKSMGNSLSDKHRTQFIQIAKAFNLNPFTREIYGIQYGPNFNIIVGYEVYLKRAERSGLLDGWEVFSEGSQKDGDFRATCIVHRKDLKHPIKRTVYFDEYNQNNQMWKTKSRVMIEKVAIATTFRQAFPDELSGMPYTEAEHVEDAEVEKPSPRRDKSPKALLAEALVRGGIPQPSLKIFADWAQLDDEKIEQLLNDPAGLESLVEKFKAME